MPRQQQEGRHHVIDQAHHGQPGQDVVDLFRDGRVRGDVLGEEEGTDEVTHLTTERGAYAGSNERHYEVRWRS